jgi:hypothetical protein
LHALHRMIPVSIPEGLRVSHGCRRRLRPSQRADLLHRRTAAPSHPCAPIALLCSLSLCCGHKKRFKLALCRGETGEQEQNSAHQAVAASDCEPAVVWDQLHSLAASLQTSSDRFALLLGRLQRHAGVLVHGAFCAVGRRGRHSAAEPAKITPSRARLGPHPL